MTAALVVLGEDLLAPGDDGFGMRPIQACGAPPVWRPIRTVPKRYRHDDESRSTGAIWGWCPYWGQAELAWYYGVWTICGSWAELVTKAAFWRPAGKPADWRRFYDDRLRGFRVSRYRRRLGLPGSDMLP